MRQARADEGGYPWCIQPELATGCSMRFGEGPGGLCSFCGLTAIRSGPGNYEYMSTEVATIVAEECAVLCPKARIEYAMRGEPLMNPKHLEIFKIFRELMPRAQQMVTTNGDTIRNHIQKKAEAMFDAGLNFILLDTYYPKKRRDELREEAFALKDIDVVDYYTDWVPIGKSPYHNHGGKVNRVIVLMDDLEKRDGEHSSRVVKTHAGANITKSIASPLERNCGRPFRELVIHADGSVPLCCDDWQQQYVIGNVKDVSLKKIWIHSRFEAARARLMQKDRAFGPCAKCDAPSAPRSGLLPLYDPPTKQQMELTEKTSVKKVPLWQKEKEDEISNAK